MMTLVKFIQLIRSDRLTRMSTSSGMSPIFTTFVQDGTIFFLMCVSQVEDASKLIYCLLNTVHSTFCMYTYHEN